MTTSLAKWGNSVSVRIPMSLIKALNLKENSPVDISADDNVIYIRPVQANVRTKVEERFAKFDHTESAVLEEYDWGSPMGGEVW